MSGEVDDPVTSPLERERPPSPSDSTGGSSGGERPETAPVPPALESRPLPPHSATVASLPGEPLGNDERSGGNRTDSGEVLLSDSEQGGTGDAVIVRAVSPRQTTPRSRLQGIPLAPRPRRVSADTRQLYPQQPQPLSPPRHPPTTPALPASPGLVPTLPLPQLASQASSPSWRQDGNAVEHAPPPSFLDSEGTTTGGGLADQQWLTSAVARRESQHATARGSSPSSPPSPPPPPLPTADAAAAPQRSPRVVGLETSGQTHVNDHPDYDDGSSLVVVSAGKFDIDALSAVPTTEDLLRTSPVLPAVAKRCRRVSRSMGKGMAGAENRDQAEEGGDEGPPVSEERPERGGRNAAPQALYAARQSLSAPVTAVGGPAQPGIPARQSVTAPSGPSLPRGLSWGSLPIMAPQQEQRARMPSQARTDDVRVNNDRLDGGGDATAAIKQTNNNSNNDNSNTTGSSGGGSGMHGGIRRRRMSALGSQGVVGTGSESPVTSFSSYFRARDHRRPGSSSSPAASDPSSPQQFRLSTSTEGGGAMVEEAVDKELQSNTNDSKKPRIGGRGGVSDWTPNEAQSAGPSTALVSPLPTDRLVSRSGRSASVPVMATATSKSHPGLLAGGVFQTRQRRPRPTASSVISFGNLPPPTSFSSRSSTDGKPPPPPPLAPTSSGRRLSSTYESTLNIIAKTTGNKNQPANQEQISDFRLYCANVAKMRVFTTGVLTIVLLNTLVIAIQTFSEINVAGGWYFSVVNNFFNGVYILELVLKLYIFRLTFFKSGWNIFDMAIIGSSMLDYMQYFVSGLATPDAKIFRLLRIFRTARAIRAFRVLRTITFLRSLQIIIQTLLRSIPALSSIVALLSLVIYTFAVIGRSLYGKSYPSRFGTLGKAFFVLFQLITLDDWSLLYDDIREKEPSFLAYAISFILVENFILINLFIAVLVNNLQQNQQQFRMEKMEKEGKRKLEASQRMARSLKLGKEFWLGLSYSFPAEKNKLNSPTNTFQEYYAELNSGKRDEEAIKTHLVLIEKLERQLAQFQCQQAALDDLIDMMTLDDSGDILDVQPAA